MSTWPASLPCPQVNTLTESPPNNVIRTNMDVGPDKVRRRTTANIRPISFTLALTPAQTQILDDFYTVDTFSGADEFDYIHPRTQAACRARFTQPPEYKEMGGQKPTKGLYNATIALEIMP